MIVRKYDLFSCFNDIVHDIFKGSRGFYPDDHKRFKELYLTKDSSLYHDDLHDKYTYFNLLIHNTFSKVTPGLDFHIEPEAFYPTPLAKHSCMNVIFFEIQEEIKFDEGKYICQFEEYFMSTLKLLIAEYEIHKPAIDLRARIISAKAKIHNDIEKNRLL